MILHVLFGQRKGHPPEPLAISSEEQLKKLPDWLEYTITRKTLENCWDSFKIVRVKISDKTLIKIRKLELQGLILPSKKKVNRKVTHE